VSLEEGIASHGVHGGPSIVARCSVRLALIGQPIPPLERTLSLALDPEAYLAALVAKYRIHLRGSGQPIRLLFDPTLPLSQPGRTQAVEGSRVIRVGPAAFVDEATAANTIAHELSHARAYLRGRHKPHGDSSSIADGTPYGSGNALESWFRGER
jgi:hypothetical protein